MRLVINDYAVKFLCLLRPYRWRCTALGGTQCVLLLENIVILLQPRIAGGINRHIISRKLIEQIGNAFG